MSVSFVQIGDNNQAIIHESETILKNLSIFLHRLLIIMSEVEHQEITAYFKLTIYKQYT